MPSKYYSRKEKDSFAAGCRVGARNARKSASRRSSARTSYR